MNNEQALSLRQFTLWLERAILSGKQEAEAEESENLPEEVNFIRIMTIHAAKGLEFPVVIIPEVQSPLDIKAQDPVFIIEEDWGLDLNLIRWGANTSSANFTKKLNNFRKARIEEEFRIFYVAVTRAKSSVILIGNSIDESRSDSWQSEVIKAKQDLIRRGARFKKQS